MTLYITKIEPEMDFHVKRTSQIGITAVPDLFIENHILKC